MKLYQHQERPTATLTHFGGAIYDHRHQADRLRDLEHECEALRAEVRRLRRVIAESHWAPRAPMGAK
jgi:hypothetical protein